MINLDRITNENKKEHNGKWAYIPDLPYRVLMVLDQEKQKHCLIE